MFIRQSNIYKVKKHFLKEYLKAYWFVPSDVLQRAIEANIWDICKFKPPVLDIGIGNGQISKYIFKNHPKMAVGIDIEEDSVNKAKTCGKYNKVICVNAEKMPFKDKSFNSVVSNSTFEHIENDINAVSEVRRILKNNGLFFLTVPNASLRSWIFEYEKDRSKSNAKDKLEKFNKRANHLHYRSISEWKRIFKKHNMEIVFYKHFFHKKVALHWYKMFKISTYSFGKRELWSLLGQSKITKFLPNKLICYILENNVLKNSYNDGFFLNSEKGGQIFMIVKKI